MMDRLQNLERLVKELREQLAASTGPNSSASSPKGREAEPTADPSLSAEDTGLHRHFGRMVVQDSRRSRYVSSGFWSRVDDEVRRRGKHAVSGNADVAGSSMA